VTRLQAALIALLFLAGTRPYPILQNEKAPLDEEFGTVKGNIEQFWLIIWPHVCNKIKKFVRVVKGMDRCGKCQG
jgi:hypothetical protein